MRLRAIESSLYEEASRYSGMISYVIREGNETITRNSDAILSSASTIKLPLLIEAFRRYDSGSATLDKIVPIHKHVGGSGVLQSLSIKEMTFKDLLALMIIVSDNTATNLVIDELGISFPYQFSEIGLRDTSLNRKMMDSASMEKGIDNRISARDLDHCLRIVTDDSFLSTGSRNEIWSILKDQQFKDKLPYLTEYTDIIVGNKTGGLAGIDHDSSVFRLHDRTIAGTVLCSGLAIEDSRSFLHFTGKAMVDLLLG